MAGILLGLGTYYIFADKLRIPYLKTTKAFKNLSRRQKNRTSTVEVWLSDLANRISGIIKLNDYKRIQLENDLQTADIRITPEKHVANAIVKAGIIGVFAIPIYFVSPIMSPFVLVLAVMMYFREYKGVSNRIKAKRTAIEYELPRLVANIAKTLKHNRDVLAILDHYRETSGPELSRELQITAADMRSGNYEAALTRLESRVGSSMLSDVTRGLIGVIRGDETEIYWGNLEVKFADYQRQLLKAQAQKVPGKMRRLSFCLLGCFLLMYIVVIVLQILEAFGGMFG